MTEDLVVRLGVEAIKVTALLSAPMLLSTLIIGLLISVVQAITQINESTLTFIPKLVVVGLVIVLAGPWMLDIITHFTSNLFESFPMYVRG